MIDIELSVVSGSAIRRAAPQFVVLRRDAAMRLIVTVFVRVFRIR